MNVFFVCSINVSVVMCACICSNGMSFQDLYVYDVFFFRNNFIYFVYDIYWDIFKSCIDFNSSLSFANISFALCVWTLIKLQLFAINPWLTMCNYIKIITLFWWLHLWKCKWHSHMAAASNFNSLHTQSRTSSIGMAWFFVIS